VVVIVTCRLFFVVIEYNATSPSRCPAQAWQFFPHPLHQHRPRERLLSFQNASTNVSSAIELSAEVSIGADMNDRVSKNISLLRLKFSGVALGIHSHPSLHFFSRFNDSKNKPLYPSTCDENRLNA
jgi:hypothetical protein